jgi:hypothetical protein
VCVRASTHQRQELKRVLHKTKEFCTKRYARVDNVPSVSSPVKNYFQVDLGVEKEAKGVWGVVMIAWKSECDELVRMDEVDS